MFYITITIRQGAKGLFSSGTTVGTVTLTADKYDSEICDIGSSSHTIYVKQTTGLLRSREIGKIVPDRDQYDGSYVYLGVYVRKEGVLFNSYARVGSAFVLNGSMGDYSCDNDHIYYCGKKIGNYSYDYIEGLTDKQKKCLDAYAAAAAFLLISPNHL